MKKILPLAFSLGLGLMACSSDGGGHAAATDPEEPGKTEVVPVDYSKGRAMNKRLGKGINLGNAWDAACYYGGNTPNNPYFYEDVQANPDADRLDACWSNPIEDSYFALVKSVGFNSVRIPVRWQHSSNPETHEVSAARLAGVMDDVRLAFEAGLAVVISFHWYYELMEAANSGDPEVYAKEKEHFTSIWSQVASAFEKEFPGSDSLLVWDILNEPTMKSSEMLNDAMLAGYDAIRSVAPGKTIMFESYHAAKFADITALKLPQDGNIIYSGHYYEPYTYTHQGHSYDCKGDAASSNTAQFDLQTYVKSIQALYPDVNGDHVPVNMGEFGVSGGGDDQCRGDGPSAKGKASWAKKTIQAAEAYGMSWHYWGLAGVGGFEAYDKRNEEWYEGFPAAFGL